MNTAENNKLIAEFMGCKPIFKDKKYYQMVTHENMCYSTNELQYHSDWNWLMQVVEKIESLHETNNVLIGTNITYVQIHNKVRNEQETFKGVSNIKIEAVYNACVTFIGWYNEQN